LAVRFTLPHPVVVPVIDAVGRAFTVIVIVFDKAGLPVGQVVLELSCTRTTSLVARLAVVNVAPVTPLTGLPFTNQVYCGLAPPLVGVAVKVTGDPRQRVLFNALEEMLTLTGSRGFTVTVFDEVLLHPLPSVTVTA